MKGRDPLLGPVRSRDDTGPGRQSHSRRRWSVRRAPWLTLFHIGSFAAVLIGWEHLDVLWPTSVFPDGLTLGASRRVAGLLTIGDPGRPARFETSADLGADWRHWVRDDERQDSSTCIAVPSALRRRLVAAGRPRLGAAGQVQYWVEMDVSSRLGPAMCGTASGVQIMRGLDRIQERTEVGPDPDDAAQTPTCLNGTDHGGSLHSPSRGKSMKTRVLVTRLHKFNRASHQIRVQTVGQSRTGGSSGHRTCADTDRRRSNIAIFVKLKADRVDPLAPRSRRQAVAGARGMCKHAQIDSIDDQANDAQCISWTRHLLPWSQKAPCGQ